MDPLIQQHLQDDVFWFETPYFPPPTPAVAAAAVKRSAFMPYTERPRNELLLQKPGNGLKGGNMNKRMIEFLRRIWQEPDEARERERERNFRHMMNERTRRERQKRSYSALHSLLPPGTKNDKNSIVQTAAKRLRELECQKEELERRNCELQLNEVEGKDGRRTKITVKIGNPTSGIDSVIEILRCLKNLGSKTINMQSRFIGQELVAVMDIQSEMGAAEVEKVVQRALLEVERKLLVQIHKTDTWGTPDK